MNRNSSLCTLATLLLGLSVLPAPAQQPAEGEIRQTQDRQVQQNLLETPPAAVEKAIDPEDTPPEEPPWLQQFKFDGTYLPGGGSKGLTISDLDLSWTFAIPCAEGWAPVLLAPDIAGHSWSAHSPTSLHRDSELPTTLYDASLDVSWRPRPAKWLFLEMGLTPGIYGDLKTLNGDLFQLRGRGLAVVAFSPQWQIVGGLLYVNRNQTKVLPAGGVIWAPNEDTKFRLVFPEPRISRRLCTTGATQWWLYLQGEFGGGRWAVEQSDSRVESVDYTDLRVLLGMEWITPSHLKGHIEAGYVFDRKVNFTSAAPDFDPEATFLVRLGISY